MKLYDEIITTWDGLFSAHPGKKLQIENRDIWPDAGNNNFVFGSDMAYELGGSNGDMAAVGGTAITADATLVPEDEILLIGQDLPDIRGDVPYARIAIARVKADQMGEGNVLYNAIRKIEYVRYHVNPKGFMMRVSSMHERESVRVSKEAVEQGLTFSKVGSLMLQSFHQNAKVEAVKIVFITEPSFPFEQLEQGVQQGEKITKAIDHILKNIMSDCSTCSLSEICDEVEGLKELHFQQS